jgi:flagellum-specific peptidoglycan hydrolase FlgJ
MLKKAEFYNNLQYADIKGWDGLILYSQCMCENGGDSELFRNAYNPFSIKANKTWKGDTYLLKESWEIVDGKKVTAPDVYRKYPNFSYAIMDYVKFIERLYPESFLHRSEYKLYYYWLIAGKRQYATDPNYVSNLIKMYDQLNVQDFKEAINSIRDQKLWATS